MPVKGLKRMSEIKQRPSDLEGLYREYGDRIYVSPQYTVVRIIWDKNGCCSDLPILLTTNERPDGKINYSCQCACGIWCTTGCETAEEAIQHYRKMTAGERLYI